jgi:hypothetical protein
LAIFIRTPKTKNLTSGSRQKSGFACLRSHNPCPQFIIFTLSNEIASGET